LFEDVSMFKGLVHPKILSVITHPHVVPTALRFSHKYLILCSKNEKKKKDL